MNTEIIKLDLKFVNAYLLKTDDKFILIDTGGYASWKDKEIYNRRDLLDKKLEENGCNAKNLTLLILTHGDCDHSANARYIRDKYKVKIAMHSGDLNLVESLNVQMLNDSANFKSLIYKFIYKLMQKRAIRNNANIVDAFEKFTPDIFIDESTNMANYALDAKIIHLPGHTDGSIGILLNNGDVIVGDVLINMSKPDLSPNAKNFEVLANSCQKLKSLGVKTVYVGHGKPFDISKLKIHI